MKKFFAGMFSVMLLAVGTLALVPTTNAVFAETPGDLIGKGVDAADGNMEKVALEDYVSQIINWVLYAIGFVAVGMIILGGVKYTTSVGNPETVKGAKNTILYGVVGLIIAVLAFAIVNFVIKAVS